MFSFGGNSCQDQQDTPFFQDNEEKPSLFANQDTQEFSAFDLFNTNNTNTSKLGESGYKQKGKQLKKSLILELKQFDKKKAFKQIESKFQQEQSEQSIGLAQSNQIQYTNALDNVVESKVSKFEESDMFKKSQMKQDNKKEENRFSKLKMNFKQERERKANEKGKNFQQLNFSLASDSNAESSQGLKFNSLQLSFQQNHQPKSKFKLRDSRISQKQIINYPSKPENKLGISLAFKLNNQKLRSSRVQNSSVEKEIDLKASKQSNPNKFSLNSFSSLLKRSTVQNKSQQNVEPKINRQLLVDSKSIKTIQKKCEPKNEDHIKTQKSINIMSKQEKLFQFPKLNKSLGVALKKECQQKQFLQKKEQQKEQKHIKAKQKPCFNLKMIRQPKKMEQKNGENEKKALQNNLVRQQINKRQDIATAKILKNTSVSKQGLTPLKKQGFSFLNVKKQQATPKLQKIESKTTKLLSLRSTQKLNHEKEDHQMKKSKSVLFNSRDKERQEEIKLHRVDFQKYQDQIFSLNEQVENTKRKAKACENSYQEIFLLLAKANTKLNTRFMSQTSLTETKQKQ